WQDRRLLDCSRHFMEKEFVKKYIDLLALYKMNVLHWHLTEDQGWRIEIDRYPLLTEVGAWRNGEDGKPYGGFYSKDDIREIVSYAQERGITVVPEIELPGHSQAALAAYPQFSCTGGPFEVETEWGVFKEIYCAGNDSTFTFLEDVLSEIMALFPSEYIHIGGDEVPKFRWEHCEKCQKRMIEEGLHDEHELQSYFIGRIGKFLHSKGKKMIGWDEILEGGLPEGAIVQSWRGFEGAKEAVSLGHQTILSPTSHSYFDYGLNDIDMEKVYSFDPIPTGITEESASLVLGGECNMWSERAPQSKVDAKVFPRILAMAEVLWSGSDKNYEEFRERVSDHYHMLDKLDVNYGFEKVPVQVSTKVLENELYVSLESYDDKISMFYEIDERRERYEEPVRINKSEHWAITFSRNNLEYPDTIFQTFESHMAIGVIPEYKSEYHKNYTAKGPLGLTDGLKGSNQFRDGNWQGYWGKDIEVTLDLGEEIEVSGFSSGFLQYNNAWIFFPENVTYFISLDGSNFEEIGQVNNLNSPKDKKQETQNFELNLHESTKARYVKLIAKSIGVCPDWHDAAGSDSWLFIDEFSIN
ncbi:MAG: family 20 glycosylhydrolase, partial [Bacteroidota bacterium]